ncbi:ABC transporter ATP-binding protein [archaeon]|nr:MAG: ABC transporter ATP-binding protein [archaeon]
MLDESMLPRGRARAYVRDSARFFLFSFPALRRCHACPPIVWRATARAAHRRWCFLFSVSASHAGCGCAGGLRFCNRGRPLRLTARGVLLFFIPCVWLRLLAAPPRFIFCCVVSASVRCRSHRCVPPKMMAVDTRGARIALQNRGSTLVRPRELRPALSRTSSAHLPVPAPSPRTVALSRTGSIAQPSQHRGTCATHAAARARTSVAAIVLPGARDMAATVATPTARSGDGPLPVAAGPRDASAVYMRDFAAALDAVDAQITAAETGAGSVPGVSGSLSPSAQPNLVVHMRNVTKTYLLGIEGVPALRGVSVSIQRGEFIVILGKSGGGKTTMLNILGTVDKPTRGDLYISGVRVDAKTPDNVLADIRLRKLGFVFQTFNLLPALTAVENVELPMILANRGTAASRRKRAVRLLTQVGMAERLWHVPNQMSGGEQQRVTIARALANEPDILLLVRFSPCTHPHTRARAHAHEK